MSEVTSAADFKREFPTLFKGLGNLSTQYKISIDPDAKPVCLYVARPVSHPSLLPKGQEEIKSMIKQGVIAPVTAPTKWCSGMVAVPKPSGSIRICVDLTMLNKAVQRERL